METSWTKKGTRTEIPASGFGCDHIREGHDALVRHGNVYLCYSACDTGEPNDKLGLLIARVGDNLLDAANWRQHPAPVLQRSDRHDVYGPGHDGFFQSRDGREDWIVYAAKTVSSFTYAHRTPRAERVTWEYDGPIIGEPPSLDTPIAVPSGDLS